MTFAGTTEGLWLVKAYKAKQLLYSFLRLRWYSTRICDQEERLWKLYTVFIPPWSELLQGTDTLLPSKEVRQTTFQRLILWGGVHTNSCLWYLCVWGATKKKALRLSFPMPALMSPLWLGLCKLLYTTVPFTQHKGDRVVFTGVPAQSLFNTV